MKFFVDECLSPDLVAYIEAIYHASATHVVYRGLKGEEDSTLIRYAIEGGYVL